MPVNRARASLQKAATKGVSTRRYPPSSIRRPYSPEKAQGMAKPAAAMAQTSVKVRA